MRYIIGAFAFISIASIASAQSSTTTTNAQHREDAQVYTNGKTIVIATGRDQQQPTPKFGTNHQINPPEMPFKRDKTTVVRENSPPK